MSFDRDAELAFVPLESEEHRAALRLCLPVAQKLFMAILRAELKENPLLNGAEALAIISSIQIATKDDMQ